MATTDSALEPVAHLLLLLRAMKADVHTLVQLARDRARCNRLVLVFADDRYREVLLNWLLAMHRLNIRNYLVISLDERLHSYLAQRGFPTVLSPFEGDLSGLWIKRLQIFSAICAAGLDFVHSDADAVWLKDPFPFFDENHQMVVSQGTVWPANVAAAQGFVMCCGFWYVRSCGDTRRLLGNLVADVADTGDDQVSLNRVLLAAGIAWNTEGIGRYVLHQGEQRFTCFDAPVTGHAYERRLAVKLLPHHLFQRLHMPGQDAFVKHLLSDKNSESKLDMLERTGCRFLAADWNSRPFSADSLQNLDRVSSVLMRTPATATAEVLATTGDERTHWTPQEHLTRYGPNFNRGMAEFIATNLKPDSVLEFGCGLGLYCDFLKRELSIEKVFGIEPEPMHGVFTSPGGPQQLAIDIFHAAHPESLTRKYDLVMSIEVAEHIPRERHDFLFDFLVSHASNWILFSGARVGQGGHGHIAERDEDDWKSEFLKRGLLFQAELTRNIRLACDRKNINHQRNLMVFRRAPGYEQLDALERRARPFLRDILSLVQKRALYLDGNLFFVNLQEAVNGMPADSLKEKRRNLLELMANRNKVLEIGFNAGHSALLMLLANPDAVITVIDTCEHPYTRGCFEYLDRRFPNRLELIEGDSRTAIHHLKGCRFDLLHYDGGKEKTTKDDLINSLELVEDDHILLIDDTQNAALSTIVSGLADIGMIDVATYSAISERTSSYHWKHVVASFSRAARAGSSTL